MLMPVLRSDLYMFPDVLLDERVERETVEQAEAKQLIIRARGCLEQEHMDAQSGPCTSCGAVAATWHPDQAKDNALCDLIRGGRN